MVNSPLIRPYFLACHSTGALTYTGFPSEAPRSRPMRNAATISRLRVHHSFCRAYTSSKECDSGVGVGTNTSNSASCSALYRAFTSAHVKRDLYMPLLHLSTHLWWNTWDPLGTWSFLTGKNASRSHSFRSCPFLASATSCGSNNWST